MPSSILRQQSAYRSTWPQLDSRQQKWLRATLIKNVFDSDISDPRKLQRKAEKEVPDEKLKQAIQITTSIDDCIKSIEEYFKAGFTRVYVHSTSPDEIKFIQMFGKKVMPYFNVETYHEKKDNTSA